MSRTPAWTLAAGLALLHFPAMARAQISFTNLAETRIGRDPDEARVLPADLVPSASRASLFDQFSLDWTHAALRLGFRFETYTASDTLTAHYGIFTRRFASWTADHYEGTVGNFEALFGRGLVLRAFELPGVVREEFGTPQFGDSRDLFGALARVHAARGELVAVYGEPRSADQDPTQPRRGQVEGASGSVEAVRHVRLGGSYLRLDSQGTGPGSRPEVGAGFVQIGFDPYLRRAGLGWLSLDSYVEFARVNGLALPPSVSSPRAAPDHGYLLYASQSVVLDGLLPDWSWGLSWEFKDYQNHELGVNEPPTLVREHPWVLLNRATHVVDPLQEHGYQLESRLDYRDHADLVLNWSRAENSRARRFHEFYAEISTRLAGRTFTVFADDAQDEIESVDDREAIGGYAELPVVGPHSLEIEIERLQVTRAFGARRETHEDRYGALSYAWAGRFTLAFVRQTTDDPNEATDVTTGERYRRAYDSLDASVDLGARNQMQLFWGRRRGGLACTAGTCYKVRGFEGVSARLVSRF